MASLVLELSNEVYEQLKNEAARQGKEPQLLVQELIAARLVEAQPHFPSNRERAREILKNAGLLAELAPELKKRADSSISIEEVRQALSRGGQSLSEIVIEQRKPES